jgi:hypothetical protein
MVNIGSRTVRLPHCLARIVHREEARRFDRTRFVYGRTKSEFSEPASRPDQRLDGPLLERVARPERLELPTSGSKLFDLLCQISPEDWLIERIQQGGTNSHKLLSPPFVVIYRVIADVFRALRDIFVTASRSSDPTERTQEPIRTRESQNGVP